MNRDDRAATTTTMGRPYGNRNDDGDDCAATTMTQRGNSDDNDNDGCSAAIAATTTKGWSRQMASPVTVQVLRSFVAALQARPAVRGAVRSGPGSHDFDRWRTLNRTPWLGSEPDPGPNRTRGAVRCGSGPNPNPDRTPASLTRQVGMVEHVEGAGGGGVTWQQGSCTMAVERGVGAAMAIEGVAPWCVGDGTGGGVAWRGDEGVEGSIAA
ncbi:hypothetical protein EDB85DRAFT_1893258 [Lactarius pseudohatsudake]|nr:hypothetical protein EDB85DRAFT_1893258 [Lactarius pseudohatsudake]